LILRFEFSDLVSFGLLGKAAVLDHECVVFIALNLIHLPRCADHLVLIHFNLLNHRGAILVHLIDDCLTLSIVLSAFLFIAHADSELGLDRIFPLLASLAFFNLVIVEVDEVFGKLGLLLLKLARLSFSLVAHIQLFLHHVNLAELLGSIGVLGCDLELLAILVHVLKLLNHVPKVVAAVGVDLVRSLFACLVVMVADCLPQKLLIFNG